MNKSILFVTPSLGVGGTEMHILRIARGLKERGHDVAFFCFGPRGVIADRLEQADIVVSTHETRGPTALLHSLVAFYNYLKTNRFDVVHFFLPKAYLLGGPLAVLAGQKGRIMSRRSLNYYQQKHRLAGFLERRLHRFMHKISGNSQKVMDQLQQEGVAPSKLSLIYNGIETTGPQEGFDKAVYLTQQGVAPDRLTLIIVANLIPYKGHQDLITALGQIPKDIAVPWQLLCVGRDEGIQKGLENQAHDLGLADHVHFLGQRDDVAHLLQCSDIGLLVSHEEGFSNAVLEGMAAGLPMVVTDVGGNREAVLDGENGLVVPAKNPDALSQAILTLMQDQQMRHDMGLGNHQRVAKSFSMAACLDAYEALYKTP